MKRKQYITYGNKCSTCSSQTSTQCLECKLWVCFNCRDEHDNIEIIHHLATRCVAPPSRPDSGLPDDDLLGPEPKPEKIEAVVEKVKELNDFSLDVLQSPAVDKGLREIFAKILQPESISNIGNDIVDEHGLTEKATEIQDRQNRMMRKIHRNTSETKDLRYLGCKCD